jgi:hypothetical protein
MNENIARRTEAVADWKKIAAVLLEFIHDYIVGINAQEYEKYRAGLAAGIGGGQGLAGANEAYSYFDKSRGLLADFLEMLATKDYYRLATIKASREKLEMNMKISKLRAAQAEIERTHAADQTELAADCVEKFTAGEIAEYVKGPPVAFTVELVKLLYVKTADKNLLETMEHQKDVVLGTPPPAPTNGILGRLVRTHIPTGRSQASAAGHGTVLDTRVGKRPLEFSLETLINADLIVAQDLVTTAQMGLNKKLIAKYNTVTEVTAPIPPPRQPGQSDPGVKTGRGEIMQARWESLLDGYERPVRPIRPDFAAGTLRAHAYHTIQSNAILANCYNEKHSQLAVEYSRGLKPSAEVMRGKLVDSLREAFKGRVGRIKSPREFALAATDADMVRAAVTANLVYSSRDVEYYYGYFIRVETGVKQFTRAIEQKVEVSSAPFRDLLRADLDRYLLDTFVEIVSKSAEEMDKDKIWTDYDQSLKNYIMEKI